MPRDRNAGAPQEAAGAEGTERTYRDVPRRIPAPRSGVMAGLLQVASVSDRSVRLRTRDGTHLFVALSGVVAWIVWVMMAIRWSAVLFRVAPRYSAPGTLVEAALLWLLFGAWGLFGLFMLAQGGRRVTVERADGTFAVRWAWGLRRRTWSFDWLPRVTLVLGAPRRRAARLLTLCMQDRDGRRVLELGPLNANDPEAISLTRLAAQLARVIGCPLAIEGWPEGEAAPAALADFERPAAGKGGRG